MSPEDLAVCYRQTRSEEHFEAIVRRYHSVLIAFVARRKSAPGIDENDVVNSAWMGFHSFCLGNAPIVNVKAWLFQAVRFQLSMARREAITQKRGGGWRQRQLDENATACETACQLEATEAVEALLASLPADEAEAFRLFYLHGYTQKEAARQLQMSLATFKRGLYRGRDRLRADQFPNCITP